jgi:hypothetical protein
VVFFKYRIEELRVFLLPAQYMGEQGKKDEIDGRDMWHAWSRRERHTEFWLENFKDRDRLEYLGLRGEIILKYILT